MKAKSIDKQKIKRFLLGYTLTDGFIYKVCIYALLISIGFVYIYPLLTMVSTSFKSTSDLINPTVNWIPSTFYIENYTRAFKVLKYPQTLGQSLLVTLLPAILQTLVTSLIGYGFAKFEFPLKKLFFALVLLTFIIPSQVYTIPKYVMFNNLNLLGTLWSIILPSLFGQGINSAVFVLIFYQFFKMSPKVLDEAADIDGANEYKIFFRVNVPLAGPAYLTTFLFSFVWYWNETYLSSLFLNDSKWTTLQIRLAYFVSDYKSQYSEATQMLNEGIRLAATLLIILPMFIMYLLLQKYFIKGVEQSGIAGE